MHQGWPKLAANLWMATPDGGLAAVVYGPSEVTTTARRSRHRGATDYPFRDTVTLLVHPRRLPRFRWCCAFPRGPPAPP